MSHPVETSPEVAAALREGRPVVALESTLIAHGLPWPVNLETAQAAEAAVRAEGAVPATVAICHGRPTVGVDPEQIEYLARTPGVRKASRRDLAGAVAQNAWAATTVAATMALAHVAGLRVFATGGIGGVHRSCTEQSEHRTRHDRHTSAILNSQLSILNSWDVSADLYELARTPVAVVCSGAKSILDLPATLEVLETLGVPVVGFGTAEFPEFYLTSSGLPVSARVDSPADAANLLQAHWRLGGAGVVLAHPAPAGGALDPHDFAGALDRAEADARAEHISGPALTPFLLRRLAEITAGRTLRVNQSLVLANARLAARVARALAGGP
jgi:pseudouridine-5'-phosphate glycosidase